MATKNKLKPLEKKEQYLTEGDRIHFIRSVIDNLFLLFFERSKYIQSLKQYLFLQFQYRTKYFFLGVLLFLVSLYFVFFFIGFLLFGLYVVFYHQTNNLVLSIFLVAWISFLIFFFILYMSLQNLYKVGKALPKKRGKE